MSYFAHLGFQEACPALRWMLQQKAPQKAPVGTCALLVSGKHTVVCTYIRYAGDKFCDTTPIFTLPGWGGRGQANEWQRWEGGWLGGWQGEDG